MREITSKVQDIVIPPYIHSKHVRGYTDFIKFLSLPDSEKIQFLKLEKDPVTDSYPYPSQGLFAKKYGVSEHTLSTWKKRPEVIAAIDTTRKQWGLDKVPNVLDALYKRCLKYGMAYDVETFLAYFANWNRTQVSKITVEKVDPDDLRTIISMLPIDKQIEAYEKLADIIGSANLERNIAEVNRRIATESESDTDFPQKEAHIITQSA